MYLGFQGLRGLVQLLSFPAACWLGRVLGALSYTVLGRYRRLTLAHLQEALGDSVTPAQRRRIARGVFRNLGQNAVEWLCLPRLSAEDLKRLVTSDGLQHLRGALAKGNGAIVVTAHFGNWELIPVYLRSLGFEGGVLARRLRYPEYESFLIGMRGDKGVPTFARGAIKDVARLLRANQIIGVMPDQDVDSLDGVFVNFLGRAAYTPVGPAALSLMTGAPILPCFIVRQGRGLRLIIEPAVTIPDTRDREQAVAQLTQVWSGVVESYIRRYPDHWVWMHRRWKTQPPIQGDAAQLVARPTPARGDAPPHSNPQLAVSLLLCVACGFLDAALTGCGRRGAVQGPAPRSSSAEAAQPDAAHAQQMDGFTLSGYNLDGTRRWDLKGAGASIDGNMIAIHHPDGIGYDAARTAYLTASAAQVNQTNRHVRMEHDVTIHTTDGWWLSTPILHWVPDENRMATDQSVRIETAHMLILGRGLEGRTQLKHAQVLEDVELVLNPTPEDPPEGPSHVKITCDGPLSFDYAENIATFEHNVHVQDAQGDLYSDTLIAYLEPESHTIRYAEARGHVRIVQQGNTARSEQAVYEPAIGKVTLVGTPSLVVYPSHGERERLSSQPGIAELTKPAAPLAKP